MDFGFNDEKFKGESTIIPYAQFINPVRCDYFGIAVRHECAEQAEFKPTADWMEVDHQFKGATRREKLWLCVNPRLVILHRSKPYMSDGDNIVAYDTKVKSSGNWKAFSYVIVLFLDENNQPLSALPFRLKCSGFAGMTFIKGYSYYQNIDNFTNQFLRVYQELSGDKSPKNNLFFAHAVYQPLFVLGEAKNAAGESSDACITESFEIPTKEKFSDFIIPWNQGGKRNPTSETIVRLQEESASWIKLDKVSEEYEAVSEDNPELEVKFPGLTEDRTQDNDVAHEQTQAFDRKAWLIAIKQLAEQKSRSPEQVSQFIRSRYKKQRAIDLDQDELIDLYNYLQSDSEPPVF